MRAIVTVLGKDRVGIMSLVCALLAQHNVNIPFAELAALLEREGEARSLDIRAQREDIFNAMHRI